MTNPRNSFWRQNKMRRSGVAILLVGAWFAPTLAAPELMRELYPQVAEFKAFAKRLADRHQLEVRIDWPAFRHDQWAEDPKAIGREMLREQLNQVARYLDAIDYHDAAPGITYYSAGPLPLGEAASTLAGLELSSWRPGQRESLKGRILRNVSGGIYVSDSRTEGAPFQEHYYHYLRVLVLQDQHYSWNFRIQMADRLRAVFPGRMVRKTPGVPFPAWTLSGTREE